MEMTEEEYYNYMHLAGIDEYSISPAGEEEETNDYIADKEEGWYDK